MYNVRGNDLGNHCGSAGLVFDRGLLVSEILNDQVYPSDK